MSKGVRISKRCQKEIQYISFLVTIRYPRTRNLTRTEHRRPHPGHTEHFIERTIGYVGVYEENAL